MTKITQLTKSFPVEKTADRQQSLLKLLSALHACVEDLVIFEPGKITIGGATLARSQDFIAAALIDEKTNKCESLVFFGSDYTSLTISCFNKSRKWDFTSDWREGFAQVLWSIKDKVPTALRAELKKQARWFQKESARLGY